MSTLPENIKQLISGKEYKTEDIGMSDANIMIFDDCVLKIEKIDPHTDEMVSVMRWLEGKIPVPRIICYEKDQEN